MIRCLFLVQNDHHCGDIWPKISHTPNQYIFVKVGEYRHFRCHSKIHFHVAICTQTFLFPHLNHFALNMKTRTWWTTWKMLWKLACLSKEYDPHYTQYSQGANPQSAIPNHHNCVPRIRCLLCCSNIKINNNVLLIIILYRLQTEGFKRWVGLLQGITKRLRWFLVYWSVRHTFRLLKGLDGWLRMSLPPPLGNFADITYLVENWKPHLLRDVCTLCSGALVCKSL